MASTQVVNFRADSISYQKTKEILADEKITVSDVLNAALRKIANGTVDAKEFVSSDLKDTQYHVAFEDLKKQLAEPPVLAAPIDKEPLLLYVAANG